MSAPKHTPGPWLRVDTLVYALDETGTCNRFSADVQKGYVCKQDGWSAAVRTSDEEAEANAALIAALPDLLETMKDFAEWEPESGVTLEDLAAWVKERAGAAIAEAEGTGA
jgi:hypothetical protein